MGSVTRDPACLAFLPPLGVKVVSREGARALECAGMCRPCTGAASRMVQQSGCRGSLSFKYVRQTTCRLAEEKGEMR